MPVEPHDVQEFLERTGWSQARLAWEIGVNQPRISRFIHGLKRPNRALEQALDGLFRAQVRRLPPARSPEEGDSD